MPVVSLFDVLNPSEPLVLIDVRKAPARAASGRTIPDALCRDPLDVAEWGGAFLGKRVVVFCVPGHEVSQGAAARLRDLGVEADWLEGGFAAWEEGLNPVLPIEGAA